MLTEWEKSHKREILEAWDNLVADFDSFHDPRVVEEYTYGWSVGVLDAFGFNTPGHTAED